ncbi:hypothetical protein ACWIGI_37755 [Nocardia sp. NPDC055321]
MSDAPNPRTARRRSWATSIEATGLTGIAFAVLSSVAVLLVRPLSGHQPARDAGAALLRGGTHHTEVVVSGYLIVFAAIALLWFIGTLRRRLGDREDKLFATVFLGSGLILIAILLIAFAVLATPNALAQWADPVTAASTAPFAHALASELLTDLAPRVAAVFIASLSSLARRTGALPRWLVVVGVLAAIALLAGSGLRWPVWWLLPAWTLLVGAEIVFRADHPHRSRGDQPIEPPSLG